MTEGADCTRSFHQHAQAHCSRFKCDGCWISLLHYAALITPTCAFNARMTMDQLHISALNPELSALESKHFRATVTLIWPYSSSTRQFAILLAEPDLRLRRKNGQVRVRFSTASAKAIATTGVGIGDEIVLSLRGAQFIQEGAISTPGKSIDWELSYTQTVVVQVFRNGSEIANLELVDAAPTPAPGSPIRRESTAAPTPAPAYSSPAFLKRARLSDGPSFEAPYDPLAEENDHDDAHDKKRRRKSYRDWKAWTFSARTPSPEKEDVAMGDEIRSLEASPSRATQLPHTPVSPAKSDMLSITAKQSNPLDNEEREELQAGTGKAAVLEEDGASENAPAHDKSGAKPEQDEDVRDADYYELYAGPDGFPSSDAQYAFGGDTEVDTEVNTEEDEEEVAVQGEPDVVSLSTTELNTEEQESSQLQHAEEDVIDMTSDANEDDAASRDLDHLEVPQAAETSLLVEDDEHEEGFARTTIPPAGPFDAPSMAMPPPTLSTLHIDVPTSVAGGMLTPIGQEPASPTLRPQDSATLPFPSPFPEERDAGVTSYFGDAKTARQTAEVDAEAEEEEHPPSDASYIGETSFFSSIGSKLSAFHPNHESAFTPVRFTFGMDGAGFSRPMELSSPEPEAGLDSKQETESEAPASIMVEHVEQTNAQTLVEETPEESEVIVLSSDSGEDSEEDEEEDEDEKSEAGSDNLTREEQNFHTSQYEATEEDTDTADERQSVTGDIQDDRSIQLPDKDVLTSTRHSAATSAIVDLGSPSEYSSDVEIQETEQQPTCNTYEGPFAEDHSTVISRDYEKDQPGSHSEFVNLDFANDPSNAVQIPEKQTVTHTPSQEHVMDIDCPRVEQTSSIEKSPPQLAIEASDDYLQDAFPTEDFPESAWEQLGEEERHPDIKMESIEEDSSLQLGQSIRGFMPRSESMANAESPNELLIAVPEDGHKLGELHTISVPTTGPARNTRSKAKTSTSPTKEKSPVLKRTTRSTRSKPSVTPIAHTAISPPRPRTRSTMSASQDATQTSPYSLRSQSKLLSPTKSTSVTTPPARRSPCKQTLHRNGQSQTQSLDPFLTSFEPSQGLSASQRSKYSDVAYVKDSEDEGSVRSEHSLSTVFPSDDWGAGMQYTNHSDPGERPASPDQDGMNVKPPPGTAPELRRIPSAKTEWKKTDPRVVILSSPARPNFSFITQPTASSPNRRLRSAGSIEAASPSPRNVRRKRRHMCDVSPEPEAEVEDVQDLPDETTPRAGRKQEEHIESEGRQLRLSQPGATDLMRSSPPNDDHTYTRQSARNSNGPTTPEATQRSTMESQPSLKNARQGQSSLIRPELTQATSVGLRSFQADIDADMEPTVSKTTPRRNVNSTDVASKSASPTLADPSSDIDSDTSPDAPSIGLSTPLAYYTPLKDLLYFLNRSSQFHSAANPDVLALVTSSTTAPERAKKGPKHWGTTLHITDASSWPGTPTSVQIFRAYQNALLEAQVGDVVLLRAFAVKSLNRQPMLVSADESSWCVWRYGKPLWGAKRGAWGELRAREEMRGPTVERGEGEWREVEKLRMWYAGRVRGELEEMGHGTRSQDKGKGKASGETEAA
jgi:hypothetical protein